MKSVIRVIRYVATGLAFLATCVCGVLMSVNFILGLYGMFMSGVFTIMLIVMTVSDDVMDYMDACYEDMLDDIKEMIKK